MKFLLVFGLLLAGFTFCTTLSNRRDLYNPSEDAGPYNSLQEKTPPAPPAPAPPPSSSL